MYGKFLQYLRLIVALAVAGLCFYGFFKHTYPVQIFNTQFIPAVQNALICGTITALIIVGVLLLITLIFGRIYCSTLCPLGLYQEFLTFLFRPFYKKRKFQPAKHSAFAYFLAAVLFGTLLGGTVVLLRMLDPYSIAGSALSGAWFGIGFLAALTVLVFFKKRYFCTNLCPVGTILGILAKFSPFKIRVNTEKCKACGLCAHSCPCSSIDFANHSVNNETCIKCFRCLSHCRHGALYYGLPPAKPQPFNLKRRQLLISGAVLLTLGAAFKGGIELAKIIGAKVKNVLLPAGAKNPADFANRCLNCNLCVRNCRMHIIKPATAEIPFVHLEYGDSHCAFNCHKCSEVCPSGAIKKISLKTKQKTKIANAVVNEEVCIRCGVCTYECPRRAITQQDGQPPLIHFEACIGCGACAGACPAKAITIEPVNQQIVLN